MNVILYGQFSACIAAHAGRWGEVARGDASPVHTEAVGELYAEVLYKVAHAIKDTEKVRQRVAV